MPMANDMKHRPLPPAMPLALRREGDRWFADTHCGPDQQTVDLTNEAGDRSLTGYRAILPLDSASAHLVYQQWRWRYYLRPTSPS